MGLLAGDPKNWQLLIDWAPGQRLSLSFWGLGRPGCLKTELLDGSLNNSVTVGVLAYSGDAPCQNLFGQRTQTMELKI